MAKAISLARQIVLQPGDLLGMAITAFCALALIAAGPSLPF